MALTYSSNYTGRSGEAKTTQIARNGPVMLYYTDEPMNYLKQFPPEIALHKVSNLVDDTVMTSCIEGMGAKQLLDIDRSVYNKLYPNSKFSKKLYNDVHERLLALNSKIYKPKYADIKLVPRKVRGQVDRTYISGSSGAGKSTWCANYALEYQREYPGNKVFLISVKEEDPAFDKVVPDLIRVPIERSIVGCGLHNFENSLVIFDDFEMIDDPTLLKAVMKLKNDILKLGRSKHISCCSIQHKSLGGKQSTTDLNECNILVLFPDADLGECIKVLDRYCSLTKEQIDRIISDEDTISQRWIAIIKPKILVCKDFIKIIK